MCTASGRGPGRPGQPERPAGHGGDPDLAERSFDRKLAAIGFPPPVSTIAHLLILANQDRIALILQEAKSTSVAGLATFRNRHKAADEAVERQARLIRKLLGLPPPGTD